MPLLGALCRGAGNVVRDLLVPPDTVPVKAESIERPPGVVQDPGSIVLGFSLRPGPGGSPPLERVRPRIRGDRLVQDFGVDAAGRLDIELALAWATADVLIIASAPPGER